MTDPYETLGLKPGATDEEVKRAYKLMAKKYHPDVTGNDPKAAEKMQEVNAAYDAIINKKSYGFGGYQNTGYSYGYNSGNATEDDEPNEMKAAANYINARRYKEALYVLSTLSGEKRNGRWYYLSSIAKAYSGDTTGAYSDISVALQKEPNNLQYHAFLDRLNSGRSAYQTRYSSYAPNNSTFFTCCLPLLLINLCCGGGMPLICCC
ncbi:MAG: DnaJ domain-containing protein [Spirochaetales bacterium]|nr:DnaJ domain-containing protein [Candidatus Physcosoma equi]